MIVAGDDLHVHNEQHESSAATPAFCLCLGLTKLCCDLPRIAERSSILVLDPLVITHMHYGSAVLYPSHRCSRPVACVK